MEQVKKCRNCNGPIVLGHMKYYCSTSCRDKWWSAIQSKRVTDKRILRITIQEYSEALKAEKEFSKMTIAYNKTKRKFISKSKRFSYYLDKSMKLKYINPEHFEMIRMKLGSGKLTTYSEIGKKFGVSKQRVKQIEYELIDKINDDSYNL